MSENIEKRSGGALSNLGGKALAVGVLLIGAYVLFKVVIGVVTAVAFTVVAIAAVIAVIWALNRCLREGLGYYLGLVFFFRLLGGVVGKVKGNSVPLWFLLRAR